MPTASRLPFVRHLGRLAAPRGEAVADEAERAAAAGAGIDGFAADLLAWRRSALVIATAVVFACATITTVDLLLRWEHHVHDRTTLGVGLDLVGLRIVTPWTVGLLCLAALGSWTRLRQSRRLVIAAAALEVLPAFAIAMLPSTWLEVHRTDLLGPLGLHVLRLATAVGLALRISGVLSAAFRSSVVTKLLVPESAVPGAIVAALTPINVGVSVVMYVAVNSVAQGWALLAGWACFVLYQLSFLVGGAAMLRPCGPRDASRLFALSRRAKTTLLPFAGILVMLFFLTPLNSLDEPVITPRALEHQWPLALAFLTNYAVTLVAGVDLIVHGIAGLAFRRDDTMRALDETLAAKTRAVAAADGRAAKAGRWL